jgi:hypothetical protein
MRSRPKNILLATTVLLSTIVTLPTASALVFTKPQLIIENLPTHSAIAQSPSEDLLLRADDDGSTYLYVEQQQGALLAVFNVTNPEHMKLVSTASTAARGSYDFVAPVKDGELISFRDGSGSALLDLHTPKAPRLSANAEPAANTLRLTFNSLISSDSQIQNKIQDQIQIASSVQPRNIQFVAPGRHPRVLALRSNVTRLVERTETGTVFLLADGKVSIVRSRSAELQYEDERIFPNDPN